jgi:hypothetical protein
MAGVFVSLLSTSKIIGISGKMIIVIHSLIYWFLVIENHVWGVAWKRFAGAFQRK